MDQLDGIGANVPEVKFDPERAHRIFPRPIAKHAVLIQIPQAKGGDTLPTFIRPDWGGVQIFYGSYYGVIARGGVVYGSAKLQWEAMHALIKPGYWVKTTIPTAYRATEPCRIVTLIPTEDGTVREANYVLAAGDWIVRQPGGEVQHIKAGKYNDIYFSDEEAAALGLTNMTDLEFADWAIAQAKSLAV
jgi:hypothetical protein